ncbi:MAG: hypothetical protein V4457_06040 [Pseudomonadota bacterium]
MRIKQATRQERRAQLRAAGVVFYGETPPETREQFYGRYELLRKELPRSKYSPKAGEASPAWRRKNPLVPA